MMGLTRCYKTTVFLHFIIVNVATGGSGARVCGPHCERGVSAYSVPRGVIQGQSPCSGGQEQTQ